MAVAHEPIWTLGNRLWRAREEAGLDQETMATQLNVSRALVSKWERDKSEPTVRQVRRWSEITGVSFSWLTEVRYSDESQSGVARFTKPVPVLVGV
jgi:transcriptional regulator with XRE-family HTH domain